MYKQVTLIDEIFFQLIKQLTNNPCSYKHSIQHGWQLLIILSNYFLPSERLRPYLLKYVRDQRNQYERSGKKKIVPVDTCLWPRDCCLFVVIIIRWIICQVLRTNMEIWWTKSISRSIRNRFVCQYEQWSSLSNEYIDVHVSMDFHSCLESRQTSDISIGKRSSIMDMFDITWNGKKKQQQQRNRHDDRHLT
jgi:hypothetical protein